MPKTQLKLESGGRIKNLSKERYSSRNIASALKSQNNVISQSTVCQVINDRGLGRESAVNGERCVFKWRRPNSIKETIKKVKALVTKENPTSFRKTAEKVGVTLKIVQNVGHDDLGLQTYKKCHTSTDN
jgi:hypothetical protein